LAEIAIVMSLILTAGIFVLNGLPVAKAPWILVVNTSSLYGESEIMDVVKTYVNGFVADTEVVSSTVIKKPTTEKVLVGTYVSSSLHASTGDGSYEGQFIWPVRWGGYITCGINGYKGHTGIDIGGVPYGTEILAAAPGVVIKAYKGWTGYGHYIIIDHGNGVQTLYAHNRKLYVKAGDVVEQGQVIAVIGETGNAYGQHLHFEIRMNGRYMNASKFIGSYYGQVVTNKIKQ
jgi:murein DD-endopeptidase MepM/ murein hydrolase activator NlpD